MNLPLYAFDIETDTSVNGLDPNQSYVTTIAIAGDHSIWSVHITTPDHERDMLDGFAQHLASLEPGIVCGWNSSGFDLPFLVDRARACGADSLLEMIEISLDPELVSKYDPLPGHDGAYRARIGHHAHLDIAYAYQGLAADAGMLWSLKPIADWYGLNPVKADSRHLHLMNPGEIESYCQSDARISYHLAQRIDDIQRWIDSIPVH